jgi:hypothetical protein
MVDLADYEAWKASQQQSSAGAAGFVLGSIEGKPDEAARDLTVAHEFGKVTGSPVPPATLVREYRNEFERKIAEAKNTTILNKSPRLSEWLRNPDNASVAHDDLENLSWLEGFGRGAVATVQRSGKRFAQMGNQFMLEQTAGRARDRGQSFGDILTDAKQSGLTDMRGTPVENWGGPEYLSAFARWADARYADLIGADDKAAAAEYAAAVQRNVDAIKAIPKSFIAQQFEKQAMTEAGKSSLGDALKNFGSAIVSNPVGALSWSMETAGESAPQLLAALATTVVTRNPVAGASVGGLGSFGTERYTAPAEFFAEKGLNLSKPEDVQRLLADPQMMQDAANRGVIRGLVIGAFDMVSMGVAGRSLAGNPYVEVVAQALSQAVFGSAGEYMARKASGQTIDWNEVLAEGLGEMATGPIDAGIAGRKFLKDRENAKAADGRKAVFEALSGQSQASALRNRLPDKFRQFIASATANGPVENVYVPAGEFVSYFQGVGIDPFAVVDEMDGVTRDDLDAAISVGGDLQIPTATYAAKIAGSEHDAFLIDNMRFNPDQMTAKEAAEFNAKSQEIMQEAWQTAENARLEDEQYRAFDQQIYDEMVSRLRVAGRSTDVATTEAALWPAFYRTMAERSHMTIDEFMGKYPLPQVAGAIPDGMKLKDVGEFNRVLADARSSRKATGDGRVSLLEFIDGLGGIDDRGGELKSRDAETVKQGKGKKTLRLARKVTGEGQSSMFGSTGKEGQKFWADDIAAAAIQAGYLEGNPIADEYRTAMAEGRATPDITVALWEGIDRELRGDRQFSAQEGKGGNDVRSDALDAIEKYLGSLGVSLDDSDADIKTAMQEAESRQYAQDKRPEWMRQILAKSDERKAVAEQLAASGRPVRLIHEDGRYALAGPDMSSEGGFRLTRFDADGPVGHTEHASLEDAILEGLKQHYAPEGPKAGPLLFQRNETGARGLIQFPAGGVGSGEAIIRLFETANLSTFVHESGHYFLAVMQDLAVRGEASAAGDMSAVKAWWRDNAKDVAKDGHAAMPDAGVTESDVLAVLESGATGDVIKDAAVDVGFQEQWARAFEQYLMEGKAPSVGLRGAFEKMRSWLLSVYRRLTGLNVKVSDDLRAVFDRMIASDDEIAKARQDIGDAEAAFKSGEQLGLTPTEFANLMGMKQRAEDDAKVKLMREVMEPIRRDREKWFREERAIVQSEVEREVNAYPMYRAIEWMGNRRWLGEGQPSGMPDVRLSKDDLIAQYGEGVLKTLPRGKQTVYTVDGGIHPDEAAGWFGYGSGDEMVRAMEQAPRRADAIKVETDRVMRERHGDVLNDGAVESAAMDAIYGDRRGEWLAAELKAVVDVAGAGKTLTAKEARATAKATMARMKVRDAISANRFLAAERKAAQEAARLGAMLARDGVWLQAATRRMEAKARQASRGGATVDQVNKAIERRNAILESSDITFGSPERAAHLAGYNENVARLLDAKRRQLMNHALYTEARAVSEEVEKAERFVRTLGKTSTRERIAGAGRRDDAQIDYLGAIDEILERYDFTRLSATDERRRGSLAAFVEAMKLAGRENELSIPDDVLIKAARAPYKTVPVEELRGVIDTLKNLEHMASRWNKLIDAKQQRDFETVIGDVLAAFDANVAKRPPGRVATASEGLRNAGRQFINLVLNASTILREIDGFRDMGAVYRNLKAPIDDAMSRLITRKERAATDLEALYSVYSTEERRAMAVRVHVPELGYSLSKWEMIAVALNMGNDGNRHRLTDPNVKGSMTEDQAALVLGKLDARDADFVQSVWDYVGSFRDDIAARERRVTGVEPDWVEATPVEVAGKLLRGGYYPLKYDPRLSALARDDQAQDIAMALQSGRFGKAQTRNGHLKERGQSSGRDVDLDISVLHKHVNQVIYDLELSEPVANSWRILQNSGVRSAFNEAGKQADFDALEIWLKDVAEGELKSADFIGRSARTVKSNFTAAKLAFNLSTVLMQITGVAQSMVVVGKRDFLRGVVASFRPGVSKEITAKSPYMSTRQTTFNKDIYDMVNDPKSGPFMSRWAEGRNLIAGKLGFWLMTKTQWVIVDIPTWLAGYQQGLRRFGDDEAKAIAHADDIVKRSQASGLFSDRSAIERGSVSRTARQNDVVRLFTTLGSYMFAKFNVAYERGVTGARVIREEGVSARSAQEALSMTLDMAFLFTLEAVLMGALKGKLPGQGDDTGEDESWLKFLAKETGLAVMGTIPFVRDGASAMQGYDGGGAYGGSIKDMFGGLSAGGQLFKAGASEDEDAKLSSIKKVISATGLAAGMPATQINRVIDAGWRQLDGADVSPLEYLIGKTGKGKN